MSPRMATTRHGHVITGRHPPRAAAPRLLPQPAHWGHHGVQQRRAATTRLAHLWQTSSCRRSDGTVQHAANLAKRHRHTFTPPARTDMSKVDAHRTVLLTRAVVARDPAACLAVTLTRALTWRCLTMHCANWAWQACSVRRSGTTLLAPSHHSLCLQRRRLKT